MADLPPEKSLDDFFAKRDKKKKKEKGKSKEPVVGLTTAVIKKTKREKEKSTKNDNQDAQIEKVTAIVTLRVTFKKKCQRLFQLPVSCQMLHPSSLICFLLGFLSRFLSCFHQ